eukprot:CAMPEP_0183354866 /NCGR_PEP_ID=MMETSP0164_2-20130417/38406_1 /TAXON_ID=221442 /ORGANISM="Coccolithus pelagicus ssp braarudi, Strain PLY182g" /LENGTH=347 /DNA_ID=CAMNT_0025527831 /DNA_START=163 /DNA_END=1206 /DNA_ORIENTATION=+
MRLAKPLAPSLSEPKVLLIQAHNGYMARLSVPLDQSVSDLRLSVSDDRALLIVEGSASAGGVEYLVHRTSAILASPSRPHIMARAHAGTVLRGYAPVHGWVELAGGQGWLSDHFLEPVRRFAERPRQFEATVTLPDDADICAATRSNVDDELELFIPRKQTRLKQSHHEPAAARYKVVSKSRLAVRTSPNPLAPVAGVVHTGDIVTGKEETANWLKVGHASYIMIHHPDYGQQLQPLTPSHSSPSAARETDQVRVSNRTEPRPATGTGYPAAPSVPSEDENNCAFDGRASKHARASTGESSATSVGRAKLQTNPVLSACKIDAVNVQRPIEQSECWAANPNGGFSRV